jgi:UDP-N-acetylmuramate dehydrogenase
MTNSEINIKNSFNLPCYTNTLYEIESNEDFLKIDFHKSDEFLIIGECTNLVLPTKLDKKVIKSKNSTINKISSTLYRVGSAANWNDFVLSVIEDNRFGIENLIGIPGSVGAAPVQNIGAYGVQVSDFIKSINIYDFKDKTFKKLLKDECDFGYRSSIFQTKPYFIIDIDFEFNHIESLNMNYEGIRRLISSKNKDMKSITSKELGAIICELRDFKLPNPKIIPNVGSFFKNPIIDEKSISYNNFKKADLIIWDHDELNVKIGAGRLIELIKSTLDQKSIDNLHSSHALIVTNKNNITYDDVIKISVDIQSKVYKEFNINLEIEPTII